jgi:hypothetical protein
MLPTGKQNRTYVALPGKVGGSWDKGQPWAVAQHYQRHLLQAGYADRLLGRLVQRLKDTGLYDRSLVVITADHGISHTPGSAQRNASGANAAEIVRVPLIVKFPAGVAAPREVSDRNVETVDILPTVAGVLGLAVPWPVDGSSLVEPGRKDRRTKAMFSGATGKRHDTDPAGPAIGPALRRKIDLFGDGARNPQRAPRLPEIDALVGAPLADLRVSDGGGAVEITQAWEYGHVDLSAPAVVFDVSGRFGEPRPGTYVAVAVNGVVKAVSRTWESNPRVWLATPRFDAWRHGPTSSRCWWSTATSPASCCGARLTRRSVPPIST